MEDEQELKVERNPNRPYILWALTFGKRTLLAGKDVISIQDVKYNNSTT